MVLIFLMRNDGYCSDINPADMEIKLSESSWV